MGHVRSHAGSTLPVNRRYGCQYVDILFLGRGDEDASAFQFLKRSDLEVGDEALVSGGGLEPWECRIGLDCCGRRCEEF
jgi:hypothetical protein